MRANPIFLLLIAALIGGCKKDPVLTEEQAAQPSKLTPYQLSIPAKYSNRGMPQPRLSANNPLTVEGIELGRMLFYDPILSDDSTQSCATCHQPKFAFSDPDRVSTGINGKQGRRQAMALINLAWADSFFWDSRAHSLEEQALNPVPDPIEMHQQWFYVLDRLERHKVYKEKFQQVFGGKYITSIQVVQAIAQFERSMVSLQSRYDQNRMNTVEQEGAQLYAKKAHCEECHKPNMLFTDNEFRNNGLDSSYEGDKGLYEVTGNPKDIGRFKVPTLRNIEFTAPYMHDGRFATLRQVVDFYSDSVYQHPNIDTKMLMASQGGVHLTEGEKELLIAFLKALSDTTFLNNPAYQNPFK